MRLIEGNVKTFPTKYKTYYTSVLERCENYYDAPSQYLEVKLKHLPKMTDWYLSIFQTVLLTGIYAANLAAVGQSYRNISMLEIDFLGLPIWGKLLFGLKIASPIALNVATFLAAFCTNKKGSPYLSSLIQERFFIRRNIAEVEIELLYISRLLKNGEN